MKKSMLYAGLMSVISLNTYAEMATPTTQVSPIPAATQAPMPVPTSATAPTALPMIDCHYAIPTNKTLIDDELVLQWATKAALQNFNLNYADLDSQLNELKACFTEQGWTSFDDAFKQSGNLDAIKNEHLLVIGTLDGQVALEKIKDNQWKATMPVQVVYQNDKEKITQSLTVTLVIGRRMSGQLGIMQVIATPRQSSAG